MPKAAEHMARVKGAGRQEAQGGGARREQDVRKEKAFR